MSGRASFSAITGNTIPNMLPDPQAGEDVLNKTVGGTNVKGTVEAPKTEPQPTVDAEEEEIAEEVPEALIEQLDILLSRAAQGATKAVDAKALQTTLLEVNLDKSSRNVVNTAAAKAEAAFKAISSFTGRQLGEAVSASEGKFNWNLSNPAAKAVKEAIEAQVELADLLRQIFDQVPNGEVSAALEEAILQCDRRACEIQTLVCEFADMLEKGRDLGELMKGVRDSKLSKLLPEKALEMHGNDAAIESMRSQFKPVVDRLDALVKNPGKTLSSEEMAAIGREIEQVSNAIEATAKSGSSKGVAVDRSLLAATKDVLADVKARLDNVRSETLKACIANFAEQAFTPCDFPLLSVKYLPFLKIVAPTLASVVETLDEIRKAADEMAKEPSEENLLKVNGLGHKLSSISRTQVGKEIRGNIVKYDVGPYGVNLDASGIILKLSRAVRKPTQEQIALFGSPECTEFVKLLQKICADSRRKHANEKDYLFNKLYKSYNVAISLQSQIEHLSLIWDTYKRMDESKFRSNGTVYAAFEGKLRVTTLVESRMRGIPDAYVDPDLDDLNVEFSRPLGSGSVNTVHEVVCKNGNKKYVFKPEASGRKAFSGLVVAKGVSDSQTVSQLNMATQKTADYLGLNDIMCKTTVGSHKGAFGIFMEKAPGKEAGYFKKCAKSGGAFAPGQLSPKKIKALPDEKYAVVIGEIMRKANRLEWFDMITGQGDRHFHNYLMAVTDAKDDPVPQVTLKAIDNDACFPAYRKGLRTFVLVGEHSVKFLGEIQKLFKKVLYPNDSTAAENAMIKFMQDPGIKKNSDNTYTIDTTLAKSPLVAVVLRNTIGVHTTALPEYIDEELYNALMDLKEPSKAFNDFKADMEANISLAAAASAVTRLREAIEYAEKLKAAGKVVTAGEWHKKDKQREILRGLPPDEDNGEYARVKKLSRNDPDYNAKGEATVFAIIQHVDNGYFRRDLAVALAKPGWFD